MIKLRIFLFLTVTVMYVLLTSCHTSKQNYEGRIYDYGLGTYINKTLDFEIGTWTSTSATTQDSIEKLLNKLPKAFSMSLKNPFKNTSSLLFVSKFNYATRIVSSGEVYKKNILLDNFTADVVNSVKKNINAYNISSNPLNTKKTGQMLVDWPNEHYLLKNAALQLGYQFKEKGLEYFVRELHFVYKDSLILRFCWFGDIERIKKNLDNQELWRETVDLNAMECYTMFKDSAHIRVKDLPKNIFTSSEDVLKTKGYLASLDYLNSLNLSYKKEGSPMQKSMYYQALMTYHSFLGNHIAAIAYADSTFNGRPASLPISELSDNIIVADAAENILDLIKNKKIVMLNEAHHIPQSRAFMRSLLKDFYVRGFRYLAVESLIEKDSMINGRKYPTQKSGYYLAEPVFGNMIREALKIGFKVFAYDDQTGCDKPEDGVYCGTRRDSLSAKNIFSKLRNDNNAKILVWAGYAHISKNKNDKYLGYHLVTHLEKLFGTEPFCIEQTLFREKSDTVFESGMYRLLNQKRTYKTPVILKKNSELWLRPEDKGIYDLEIFFPRTDYEDGIPTWQHSKDAIAYTVRFPENKIVEGELLQVFVKNEYEREKDNAVPVLNHQLDKSQMSGMKIYLDKGDYFLIVRDVSNNVVFKDNISIK